MRTTVRATGPSGDPGDKFALLDSAVVVDLEERRGAAPPLVDAYDGPPTIGTQDHLDLRGVHDAELVLVGARRAVQVHAAAAEACGQRKVDVEAARLPREPLRVLPALGKAARRKGALVDGRRCEDTRSEAHARIGHAPEGAFEGTARPSSSKMLNGPLATPDRAYALA